MTTFSDTVVETASAADAPIAIAILHTSITEALSAKDGTGGNTVFNDKIVESASSTDAPNAVDFNHVIESVSAVDTTNTALDEYRTQVIESVFAAEDTHITPVDVGIVELITLTESLDVPTVSYKIQQSANPIGANWMQMLQRKGLKLVNTTYTNRSHSKKWVYPK